MSLTSPKPRYQRLPPLVLINGLAEQAETWYCNLDAWRQHFDVHTPNFLTYDGPALHRRIDAGLPIDVDYLVEQLRIYVDTFVQRPSVHLLANSMGGKIAVEFAARYPDQVDRFVLLCPSGLSAEERLPVVDSVRRSDPASVIQSVFQDANSSDPNLVQFYAQKFTNRAWRSGLIRTIRGTMEHRVVDRLDQVRQPTLLVVGENDRIVSPADSMAAVSRLPNGRLVVLRNCGHAPQIEAFETINELVVAFLLDRPTGVESVKHEPNDMPQRATAVQEAS
jgi:2-hydroxy-6-oxonona-2,4-dienedioate hydrolase